MKKTTSMIAPLSDSRNCLVFDVDTFKGRTITPAAEMEMKIFCRVGQEIVCDVFL